MLCKPSGGEIARERDEGLEGSGGIAPIGIIEAQRCEWRRPVFENTHEPSRRDVVAHIGFHEIADPYAVRYRDPGQRSFVEGDWALNVELQFFAAPLEPPSEQCAIGKPHANAGVSEQLLRHLGIALLSKKAGDAATAMRRI